MNMESDFANHDTAAATQWLQNIRNRPSQTMSNETILAHLYTITGVNVHKIEQLCRKHAQFMAHSSIPDLLADKDIRHIIHDEVAKELIAAIKEDDLVTVWQGDSSQQWIKAALAIYLDRMIREDAALPMGINDPKERTTPQALGRDSAQLLHLGQSSRRKSKSSIKRGASPGQISRDSPSAKRVHRREKISMNDLVMRIYLCNPGEQASAESQLIAVNSIIKDAARSRPVSRLVEADVDFNKLTTLLLRTHLVVDTNQRELYSDVMHGTRIPLSGDLQCRTRKLTSTMIGQRYEHGNEYRMDKGAHIHLFLRKTPSPSQ